MWYVATLIIRSKVDNQSTGPWTCQEQIRIIEAPNEDEAYRKSIKLGQGEEHSYRNVYGELVYWEFIGLEDLEELSDEEIQDGMEIRCRFLEKEDPASLVNEKEGLTVYKSRHDDNNLSAKTL